MTYNNESISSLKGAERVRKRPAVIFGSDGIDGCKHCIFEILSNSIDEAREGFGTKIIITKFFDGSFKVEDFGRGIPVDFNNKEGRYNWELLFTELYAGGKYNNNDDLNYEFSLGMNGLGLCATQYASEFMNAEIKRDGFLYSLNFKKGENVGGLNKISLNGRLTSGTTIHWKPDKEVFTETDIPNDIILEMVKRQAIVNPGIDFYIKIQNEKGFEEQKFRYENGISDYIAEIGGNTFIAESKNFELETFTRDRMDKPEYKLKIVVAMGFSTSVNLLEFYHNSSWLEYGGAPEKAARAAFVSCFDSFFKQLGKYNKNESKVSFDDIKDCLILVISSFSVVASYENQTKKAITNKGIYEAITKFLKHTLEIYFLENPIDAEKIAIRVLLNKRSREDAEKTRLNLKKKLTGNFDLASRVSKFVDCRSKDITVREIFIVEGDSALGACKQARDPEFQAIIPIRGKILNCLKSDFNKILNNEIIVDLIKILGCGVVFGKLVKNVSLFKAENLRWNKVIICTDADVDGFQIRTLVLAMIYRLIPELIRLGKIFIAESPLYEINSGSNTFFAYNEAEKEEFLREIAEKKFTIQRSKGLGENEPDMMNLTTMNPATRRLIKILPDDTEKTSRIFDVLLGENLEGRKEYIRNYGSLYLKDLDLS
jgi:DNA gyrase subunit B